MTGDLLLETLDARLPLYQRLRDAIVARIASGAWAPGESIPSESEIARANGVAIGTVRKAVDVLVAEGVLDRAQGRGTFVRRPSLDRSLFRFFRAGEPGAEPVVPEGRILSRKAAPCPASAGLALGLAPGTQALRLLRLRLVASMPLLAEEIWLDLERFAPLATLDLTIFGDLLYPLYERQCGEVVAFAEETLTVDVAGPRDGETLGLVPGCPVVVIERIARGYDRHPIEWRRSRGPADQFKYRIEIH